MSGRKNIRFRVWDVQNKVILPWTDIWYSVISIPAGSLSGQEKDESVPFISLAANAPDTKYILDQSTGSLDRNGQEVYDNDILKDLTGRVYRIKWQSPQFVLIYIYPDGKSTEKAYVVNSARFSTEMTIIGNIHQTPELYVQS